MPDWHSRRRLKDTMIASKKLSAERLEELARINAVPDDENPEITEEQAKKLRLARESHPEWFRVKPIKQQITIKIDKDILEALRADGKGYQTRINTILREAVFGNSGYTHRESQMDSLK